jgi:hypothetical protein
MKEEFKFYNVSDLKVVDVRKYNGIEDGSYSWTFLGYDVVKVGLDGKANSIFEDVIEEYDFLKPIKDSKYICFYDHSGILIGDIRVKEVEHLQKDLFGILPCVSKNHIQNWINKNPNYEFLHYKPNAKVKKLIQK